MKKLLLLVFSSVLLLPYCKVVKYTPDKLPTKQIIFGDGGGFTGIETSYTLLENGQVFKQVGVEGPYEELKSIKQKAAKELFSQVASLQLYKMDIEKPGNIYYFIQEVNATIDSRVTWGAGDYLPPRNLIVTYKDLVALVSDREIIKGKSQGTGPESPADKKPDKKNTDW